MKSNSAVADPDMRCASAIAIGLLLGCSRAGAADLRYVGHATATRTAVVVDTRPLETCLRRTFAGAHCLPASDLIGPDGELPSFPDLLWALGTAGLSGHETVLVIGDAAEARDFVAGLLYLAGQARVEILTTPPVRVLDTGRFQAGSGRARGILRSVIHTAQMRDDLIVLPGDLLHALRTHANITPIDGRSPDTYDRPGHIPGALNAPEDRLAQRAGNHRLIGRLDCDARRRCIVYGAGPMGSIALLARLRASGVANVQVLIGGWRAWAAAGYPVERSDAASVSGVHARQRQAYLRAAGLTLLAAGLFVLTMMLLVDKEGRRWT